ncbi:MAG: xanthine dehydrogenase accessory factor [Microbacteriaceae bacterium]|nr:xanthine dehydrogenase accessory factor [Microbacteriaceae bacterium]
MFELARDLLPLLRAGEPVAVATAVDVVGSSPYGLGSSMAVTADGRVLGSVAGGCVETAALEACRRLLAGGPPGVERFGFGQAAGEAAGLSCGGELDVLLHMPSGACVEAALTAAASGRDAALAVVTTGPRDLVGAVLSDGPGFDRPGAGALPVERIRAAVRDLPVTGAVEVQCDPPLRLFVEVSRPAPLFAVIGATAIARPLAAGARLLGYRVVVCDHRPGFAAPGRVPEADEVVQDLPHRWLRGLPLDDRSVVVLLTHDAELDPLALAEALERDVAYVGALGSRATAASRERQLAALGVDAARLPALHSPIGLDLGGGAPAEIAVSILAEVIAGRTGRSGEPLRGREGPVRAALG